MLALDSMNSLGTVGYLGTLVAVVALAAFATVSWMGKDHQPHQGGFGLERATLLFVAFLGVAVVGHRARAGTRLDHDITSWFVDHRTGWETAIAKFLTNLFSPTGVVVLCALSAIGLWIWLRRLGPVVILAGTLLVAFVLRSLGKSAAATTRPQGHQLITETDYSMPSGHVTGIVTLAGMLAIIIGAELGKQWRTRLLLAAAVLTLVIAWTRLYLGVHWFTDVLAGALLGSACVVAGSWFFTKYEMDRLANVIPKNTPAGPALAGTPVAAARRRA